MQYAAPLVCMEARKRARLSQKGARKNSWTIDGMLDNYTNQTWNNESTTGADASVEALTT